MSQAPKLKGLNYPGKLKQCTTTHFPGAYIGIIHSFAALYLSSRSVFIRTRGGGLKTGKNVWMSFMMTPFAKKYKLKRKCEKSKSVVNITMKNKCIFSTSSPGREIRSS